MNSLFFEILQVAIGNKVRLSRVPTVDEWDELYAMAEKQSLVGICFAGVQRLMQMEATEGNKSYTMYLPEENYLNWMGMAVTIQQQGEKHREMIGKISELLAANGIDAIFMKGLVCASRYRTVSDGRDDGELQLLRQCGDIDFVVRNKDYAKTLEVLEKNGEVDWELVHEHHGMAWVDDVQLEPHYKIHNYQNPWNDRMMRRLQKEVIDAPACYVEIEGRKIRKFPMEFEGMFLVSHMVNHVYEEGLGLRQIMDFAFWIKALSVGGIDMELYHTYLDKMHMRRAARIFTRICEKYLGMDSRIVGYIYTEKEIAFADKLAADIMEVGNFAKSVKLEAGLQAYMWTTKRSISLGYLCPSEAYWWPVSKFFRYFWRIMVRISRR